MIVTIHQPLYLPWLGFFGKIMMADAFVVLDSVQYVKNEWENRNRVRTPEGWQWLTVPVEYHFPQTILETRINNRVPWQRKHLKTIRQLYSRAPFFDEVFPYLEQGYERQWDSLTELNVWLIRQLLQVLKIDVPLYRASELEIQSNDPTGRLIEICQQLGGTEYLSGSHGRDYLEIEEFKRAELGLCFQGFEHPQYEQRYPGFEPYLSVVDMLFCVGPDETRQQIAQAGRKEDFSGALLE